MTKTLRVTNDTSRRIRTFAAGSLSLSFIEEGAGPVVILLHGFPDTALTWTRTQRYLANGGYRSVALHMRGYAPSEIPPDRDFSIRRLAADILELVKALGQTKVAIVGHDWGASVAYAIATMAPERLSCITALAIPPPRVFRAGLRERLARPHNIYLRAGPLAEWWLRLRGFREIDRLYKRWSPSWSVPASHLATVKAAFAEPGRARAAVDYYSAKDTAEDNARFCQPIQTPTLIIYGADEPKVRREKFRQAPSATGPELVLVERPRVGHWPHLEDPEGFERELLPFLDRHHRK